MNFNVIHAGLVVAGVALALDAAPVEVRIEDGSRLLRGGQPYFIKGAGGETRLDELARRGGNSLRTWSPDKLEATLAEAEKLGLTVCAGIWLEPECAWFSYAKPEHCARQTERVRQTVRRFRDHPALLLWGLGNESEGDGRNAAYWRQLDELARMAKSEDPAHPTFTAVAGLNEAKAQGLNEHAPHLDLVGINTYGGMFSLRTHLEKIGWTRPWVVTEYGPQGFWESPRTPWGAPLEQTSAQKAEMLGKAYAQTIAPGGKCLGSYAFLWGQKQEATATWFGLFTATGESTPSADVLQEIWSGAAPANCAPTLAGLVSEAAKATLARGAAFQARVDASDRDDDALACRWEVTPEHGGRNAEGRELPPASMAGALTSSRGMTATFRAPDKPGGYRVFVFVTDGKGHAATANFPFLVAP